MTPRTLEIKTSLKIQKPVEKVFEAIVNPEEMSNYFISKGSGKMEAGKTINWRFPEFDMEFPVFVDEVKPNKFISYRWQDFEDGKETTVNITLEEKPDGTFVTVTEKERDNDEKGIRWLAGNTGGWANFLACLKAWLEYGVHLRKGAFDISQMPKKETDITV